MKLVGRPRVLRDPARAPAYLRSVVLNGARSALRHGKVDRHAARHLRVDVSAADVAAIASDEHRRVIDALRESPTASARRSRWFTARAKPRSPPRWVCRPAR